MDIEEKIHILLDEIADETCLLSYHIEDHPKLLEIVGLGDSALPVLFDFIDGGKDSSYTPGIWYAIAALPMITKECPIKPGHEGRLLEIIKDWLEWRATQVSGEK